MTWCGGIELGKEPVAVDLAYRSLIFPHWLARNIRNKSGWLRVTTVQVELSFGTLQRDLLACVDDYGHPLPVYLAKQFFTMGASYPYPPDEPEPHDLLDRREDELLVRFLGHLEKAVRAEEAEAERRNGKLLERAERLAAVGTDLIGRKVRELRRARRAPNLTSIQRLSIAARIQDLEQLGNSLIPALGTRLQQLRDQHEARELELLADREETFELDVRHTLRWRVIG